MKQVLNLADTTFARAGNGDRFAADFAVLGAASGAQKLGVSCTVATWSRASRRHARQGKEEILFLQEGAGSSDRRAQSAPVRAGDLIAAPPGDGATAHQIEVSSDEDRRDLTFSTKLDPAVVAYRDSGTVGGVPKAGGRIPVFRAKGPLDRAVDLREGESG